MPLKITPRQSDSDGRTVWVQVGKGRGARWHNVETGFIGDPHSPIPLHLLPPRSPGSVGVWDDYLIAYWICRGRIFHVEGAGLVSYDELMLRIQHAAVREEKVFKRLQCEVQAFENLPLTGAARRERIPDDVRLFVWQRDEGKCVHCRSNLNLEFDHIIPVAEGGSSTARNIQLLCEICNRQKGKSI
jgi:hypothetical protein